LLTAANLNNVPAVLHSEADGLGLVVKRDGHYVIDDQARTAAEVLRYLTAQKDYGVAVTGRLLTERFQEPPYGWEQDLLRVVLAGLFRAGKLVVTHNGRQFKNYTDPAARLPLTNLPAFRSATFEPRGGDGLTIPEQTKAVETYEELTGSTVDVEPDAIASAYRHYAARALTTANEVDAVRAASGLPTDPDVIAYRSSLAVASTLDTIDAVRSLNASGKTLKEGRDAVRRIGDAIDKHLGEIKRAQTAVHQMWPAMQDRSGTGDSELAADAEDLHALLASPNLYSAPYRVIEAGKRITSAYQARYKDRHERRRQAYAAAIEAIKGLPEWAALAPVDEAERADREADRRAVLAELERRACANLDLRADGAVCATCGAALGQIESDLVAVDGLRQAAVAKLRELASPAVTTCSVHVRDLALGVITCEEDISPALDRIGQRVREALGPDTVVVLE
jgi:hypothetical protein